MGALQLGWIWGSSIRLDMGSSIRLDMVLFDKAGYGALQLGWIWGSSIRLEMGIFN